MNRRILAFLAALLVFVAAAYVEMKPADRAELAGAPPAAGASPAAPAALAARSTPGAVALPASTARGAAGPGEPSLYSELQRAVSYRALYDRLLASAEGATAEERVEPDVAETLRTIALAVLVVAAAAGATPRRRTATPGEGLRLGSPEP